MFFRLVRSSARTEEHYGQRSWRNGCIGDASPRTRDRASTGQWKASEPWRAVPVNAGRRDVALALVRLWHSIGIRASAERPRPSSEGGVFARRCHSSDIRRQTFDDSWAQCGSPRGGSTGSAARVSRRRREGARCRRDDVEKRGRDDAGFANACFGNEGRLRKHSL